MKKFLRSTSHAIRGLMYVWKEERNFRTQTLVAFVILGAAGYFQFTVTEFSFLILACALVLGAEIMNTLVEDLLDEIHPDHHSAIGKAKDMMASVVLVHSLGALAIGIAVFGHHFALFSGF